MFRFCHPSRPGVSHIAQRHQSNSAFLDGLFDYNVNKFRNEPRNAPSDVSFPHRVAPQFPTSTAPFPQQNRGDSEPSTSRSSFIRKDQRASSLPKTERDTLSRHSTWSPNYSERNSVSNRSRDYARPTTYERSSRPRAQENRNPDIATGSSTLRAWPNGAEPHQRYRPPSSEKYRRPDSFSEFISSEGIFARPTSTSTPHLAREDKDSTSSYQRPRNVERNSLSGKRDDAVRPSTPHSQSRPRCDADKSPRHPTTSYLNTREHRERCLPNHEDRLSFSRPIPHVRRPAVIPVIHPKAAVLFFQSNVAEWATRPHTLKRVVSYGLPIIEARTLLRRFAKDVQDGILSSDAAYYGLERFGQPHDANSIDIIYSTVFFSWTAKTKEVAGVHPNTFAFLNRLLEATSRPFPSDEFPHARSIHRKIIMHIGPTNSGKTHHALRALAAAKTGVYAGPLRLLAHEIWQRLNTGQIVPLGVDEEVPADKKFGMNPEYERQCNMITGEEQRIVDEDAGLLSCTVEMLSSTRMYDVAVIDEIQMIADSDRGNGWTQAVLGIRANEVHLCGEETAVPIVQALLEDTGDEIIVRRYERLTPLTVDEHSLNGDLTKIQKGDCIVTFSRSSIFAIKKAVEEQTGMRCAVVYGRLPPETRSEQAALFNDPDSGYDVIIGSDAIGMGLNLKIKRVIFAATSKFNGKDHLPLPVSSVKQIAGRAGRFGLHKEQADLGGSTTTMFAEDLPHLTHCIATPYTPLPYGRVGYNSELISNVLSVLPAGTPMAVVLSAAQYIGRLPVYLRYANQDQLALPCSFLDNAWQNMTNGDKVSLLYSPIPWRDHKTVEVIQRLLLQQSQDDVVDFRKGIEGTGFIEMLEAQERLMDMAKEDVVGEQQGLRMSVSRRRRNAVEALLQIESFHKVMVLYLWMSYRSPIVYSGGEEVQEMKGRLERVLNWSLESLSLEITKQRDLRTFVHGDGEAKSTKGKNGKEEPIDPQLEETVKLLTSTESPLNRL